MEEVSQIAEGVNSGIGPENSARLERLIEEPCGRMTKKLLVLWE